MVATLLYSNNRMVLDNALGKCEYLGAAFFPSAAEQINRLSNLQR